MDVNEILLEVETKIVGALGSGVTGLAVDGLQELLYVNLMQTFSSEMDAVTADMVANRWFPFPSQRAPISPSHEMPGPAVYYSWRRALAFLGHGVDNTAAGLLQLGQQPGVVALLGGLNMAAGTEQAYLSAVMGAIAELTFPVDSSPSGVLSPATPVSANMAAQPSGS